MSSTWFVTGASRGFGRELTDQLLARGDRVAATLRRPEQLADLAAAHGDRLWVRALDVTDTAQLREVVDAAFTELGRIDVVVSNAGYGVFGAAEALSDTQIDVLIATNLTGCIQLARAVAPHLRAQGGGRILQMSSMGGLIGFPGFALYMPPNGGSRASSKPSLRRLSRSVSAPRWSSPE
jgi:NAD(P)-dependent dehydrogenase (short-subunit alcohol dehydrogenase family)